MKLINKKELELSIKRDKRIICSECDKTSEQVVSFIIDNVYEGGGVWLCKQCLKKGYILLCKDERLTLRIEEDK